MSHSLKGVTAEVGDHGVHVATQMVSIKINPKKSSLLQKPSILGSNSSIPPNSCWRRWPADCTFIKSRKMKSKILTNSIATGILSVFAFTGSAFAQQSGVKRTDLQQHDLSIPGREMIQVRVDIAPGVLAAKHTHPGEEIIYVLEGELEYQLEGKPPVTLNPGQVLFIPAGTPHTAKNVGKTNGAELATYIVEKGKPLVTLIKQ